VEFVAGNPPRSRPVGQRTSWGTFATSALFATAGGLMVWFAGASLLSGFRTLRQRVRLVESGHAAAGVVDRLEPVHGRSRILSYDCHYRFFLPARGSDPPQVLEGSISLYPRQSRRFQPGQPLLILFDPQDPATHTVDLHQARTEDPAALWRPANLKA
jgi:hypothetical protein